MIKYITPVRPGDARGLVGDVYKQIKGDFGAVVDPFAVHSVSPRLLAAVWSACRESQLVGIVPREIKEAVAVTVSQANECPFCIDAHVVMLHAVKAHAMAQALTRGRPDRLSERNRTIYAWARTTGKGQPCVERPRLAAAEAPELIGIAVFYHYMNRICTVLLDDSPLPSTQRWVKGFLSRTAGWYFSFAARRPKPPGASLAFLPDADLPDDLAWAGASDPLAGAWARFAHEIDRQGRAALPDDVRKLATDYLQRWESAAGIGRDSVEDAVVQLGPAEQPAGRLVLLTAFAPHQIDDQVVRGFVDSAVEQEKLLGALAWASFAAARRIGARLKGSTVSV